MSRFDKKIIVSSETTCALVNCIRLFGPVLLLCTFAACLFGQQEDLTWSSSNRAIDVLKASIAAYGGIDRIDSIESIQVIASGSSIHRTQSRRIRPPFDRDPYRIETYIDLDEDRIRHSSAGGFPGGFEFRQTLLIRDDIARVIDSNEGTFTSGPSALPAFVTYRLKWLPQFALVAAFERQNHARYLGQFIAGKRKFDVLTFAEHDGSQIGLEIDTKTRLISKITMLGGDLLLGEAVIDLSFSDYRIIEGHPTPMKRTRGVGGETIEVLTIGNFGINKKPDSSTFSVPAELKAPASMRDKLPMKVGENVYLVNGGGYNVLAIGFRDHIMIVEAPLNDVVSQNVINQVKTLFPNRPVKYVAVTHHHDDHAGGIRAYIDEGATVITTAENQTYFKSISAHRSRQLLRPIRNTKDSISFDLVPRSGRKFFSDGTTTVEFHDIGIGPHADEMLVVYLPHEKTIFQGDLLNRSTGGRLLVNETTLHFAKWLEAKRFDLNLILPVHGEPLSLNDFKNAVNKRVDE